MESELKFTSQNVLHLQIFFFWPTHKVKFKISTWDRVSRKCLLKSTGVLYVWQGLAVTTLESAYHFFQTPQNIVKFSIIYIQLIKFNLHFLCSSLIHISFNTENGRVEKQKHPGKSWCFCEKLFKKYILPLIFKDCIG